VLHLTQPAMSNAPARLRALYPDPLFVRTSAGMMPTPTAETIAANVRAALQMLAGALDSAAAFDPRNAARRFRISSGDLTAAMLIPRLMQHTHAHELPVELEVTPLTRESVVHELASEQADFAPDAIPLADPRVITMKVLEDEFVCAVRDGHPAAGRRLTLAQYLALDPVHASSRRQGVGQLDLALKRLGRQRRIVLRTPYQLSLPHIVAMSDYAASIPRSLAVFHRLRALPLPCETPAAETFAAWHKSANADGASLWFREMLQQLVPAARS
jgi:DNA-binding transcriptional LysR family regulator